LIAELAVARPIFTLSDFPLSRPTYEGLARLQSGFLPKASLQLEDVEDIYPCSPIQQGILVSQAKAPSEYHIQQSFEVRAANSSIGVKVDGLLAAWQTLVNRHPIMRTIFIPSISDSEHVLFDQMVLKSCKPDAEHRECASEDVASLLAVKTGSRSGIHGSKPSHRLTVYSTPSGRVYAQITISHALVDASSLVLLQNELLQAYDGRLPVDGKGPLYSGYVAYLLQNPADGTLGYWNARLRDAQPCYLPALTATGFPGNSAERSPLQIVSQELNNPEDLRRFAEAHGVTPANVFQLAWALVLSQYTGSTDVSFGYLVSGRDVPVDGVGDLLGPLINIMVTRINIDPEMHVREALQQVQNDFFEDFNHQRTPLLDIWHALQLQGESLFNTSLSYRHASANFPEGGEAGLVLDIISGEDPTEYDANINVVISDGEISVSLQYSPDFMSPDGAARLLRSLLHTVPALVKAEDLPVGDVGIVTREDVQQLQLWNEEVPRVDRQCCIHDLVHQQRVLQPQRLAVCAWDGDLTYEELEDMADHLAHHLAASLGVGPEVMVALCFHKSKWAVVAQLAVLKAGGCVVSVNPNHPLPRIKILLDDCAANVVLAAPELCPRFLNILSRIVEVDSNLFSTLPKKPGLSHENASPRNAAFVIYTSGSTGLPKGVVLTHASLCSSLRAHGNMYGMCPTTRTIQCASYTFDASISDLWGTICYGGCVIVISEEARMNDLSGAIGSYCANLAQLTPTVASLLDISRLPSLKTLVLGGEAVKADMIDEFSKATGVTVLNGYGPSECSIYTTCSAPLKDRMQAFNIGRPLAGTVWIVNDRGGVSPIGAVGELWIEGPLLAREYINDRQKTEKSFVANPAWSRVIGLDGRRFYRTGDLCRMGSNGDIIYIGRRDTQTKIRGQRIDIGEIEYYVKRCLPSVKSVVGTLVDPGGDPDSRRTMVAAVIEEHHTSLPPDAATGLFPMSTARLQAFEELHASLFDVLPSYMVPKLFVPIEQVPMTTSGKVGLSIRILTSSVY
jgi:amino acid adenylation domain-containing protein